MAVSSLVLGIVGLVLSLNIFTSFTGLICGILAVIFGAIGISKKNEDCGKGIAGVILGVITLIICIILIVLILKVSNYIESNIPKFLEEMGEFIENSIEEFNNYVDELVDNIKSDIVKEIERNQINTLRNIF